MSVAEELAKLKKMLDDGTITEEQYERARAKLLDEAENPAKEEDAPDERRRRPRRRRRREDDDYRYEDEYEPSPRERRKKARDWCMFLHLSLFAGHTVPMGGIIVPIIIWQTQKDEMPEIDEHGKNAVNWIISSMLYTVICIALCFVFVGFVLLPILVVLNIVFPIIAAVKANEGQVWKYPLAIPFFT